MIIVFFKHFHDVLLFSFMKYMDENSNVWKGMDKMRIRSDQVLLGDKPR